MNDAFELLILAVSRVKKGIALAGMTTEPHPVTGRTWVEIVHADGPLTMADITLDSGKLVQPGDVIRWDGLEPHPEPPLVERWVAPAGTRPTLLRHITPERYARFLPEHLDRDPDAVLKRGERSLCLVRSEEVSALFEDDERRFKTYLLFSMPDGSTYDAPVVDLAWRAQGRAWLAEHETAEMALEIDELRERFGALYLIVGRHRDDQFLVRGVHTIPAFDATIDPHHP